MSFLRHPGDQLVSTVQFTNGMNDKRWREKKNKKWQERQINVTSEQQTASY